MPTIRVDGDVWEWLKRLARPLEDTPNSILRRVAGLDPSVASDWPGITPRERKLVQLASVGPDRLSGDALNKEHKLGAKQAFYHKDGTLYDRLTAFPGILCDPRGYVPYDSREQFEKDSLLTIGQKVNVPRGLATHKRYRLFPDVRRMSRAVRVP